MNENNAVVGSVTLGDNYLPSTLRPMQANKWYRVIIPLSHFFSGTVNLASVAIETDIAATFSVDDVRLVQRLGWPKGGPYPGSSAVSGYHFGEPWEGQTCKDFSDKRLLHTGVDYGSSGGMPIKAAARGVVKNIASLGGNWGQGIVLDHEDGLTTNYLHTDPISGIDVGVEVQRGQQIGMSSYISSPHLHFGIRAIRHQPRIQPENIDYSIRGRLPHMGCTTIQSPTYPEKPFPYFYLDSEMMNWGTL